MKVAFPGNERRRPCPWVETMGGAGAWIDLFQRYLKSRGHEVTGDWKDEYDILVNIADRITLQDLKSLRAQGRKILYRMDGLYWEYLWPDSNFEEKNEGLKQALLNADQIVFQSNFVKSIVRKRWKCIPEGVVIPNAADPEYFFPTGPVIPRTQERFRVICANSGHPLLSTWIITQLEKIMRTSSWLPLEFWLLGKVPEQAVGLVQKLPQGITFRELGLVPHSVIGEYLRSADLLLHLRPNDPCPNLVIEAMSCGTPILALESGSIPELLGEAGVLVCCENSLEKFPEINCIEVYQKLIQVIQRKDHYRPAVLERALKFSWDSMGARYLQELERLMLNS